MDDPILKGKYPAKAHCRRLAEYLKTEGLSTDGIVSIEGGKTRLHEDCDQESVFRQRRHFFYLSGVPIPDCSLTYNIKTDHLTLFIPPLDPDSVVWSGLPLSPSEALQKYDVDSVLTSSEAPTFLTSPAIPKGVVYAIPEQQESNITFLPYSTVDLDHLRPALDTLRVVKDSYELALLRRANAVSAAAHKACQDLALSASLKAPVSKPTNEQDFLAEFNAVCARLGNPLQAYSGIFASGINAATLHYVQNDQPLAGRQNILIDAGAEDHCYAADVTRTFPLTGSFTSESRAIYEIVQSMQDESLSLCRAGVSWEGVHEKAHRVAIRGLLGLGILHNGNEEEIFASRTSCAFFPHGLGHYLGLDTHDTGGNANYADKDEMFRYLRVRGEVPEGAVITNEPGIYFCRFILEPAMDEEVKGKFINRAVVEKYWDVGGVRIEDDILILKDGWENLTTAPRGMGL